ncbi:MAG: SDR family NAD(P)-dependent oxidoreductase, partial [Kiritimatiellae bacterium]|nr:SDR family NAD(P)-dependent oxidoreductase [Kiritimatiellia bacterium]
MKDLSGKVAIVTGGAKGIGKAIAERFVADGASVVVADCDETAGQALAEASQGAIVFEVCDVSDEAAVERVLEATEARFGKIDILVNDAAVQLNKPLLETSAADFDRVMRVNVTGAVLFMKGAAKRMIAKQIAGSIVNFSSTFAIVGSPGYLAYHASKGAIASMTRAAAVALLPH